MAEQGKEQSEESISLEELREFIRSTRSPIIPEKVAVLLEERTLSLEFAEERVEIFTPLVEDLEERLAQRNIRLPFGPDSSPDLSSKEFEMVRSLAILQSEIASALVRGGRFSEVAEIAQIGIETCRVAGHHYRMSGLYEILSQAAGRFGDFNRALELQRKAHRIGVEQNNPEIIRRSLHNQGVVLSRSGQPRKALELFYQIVDEESPAEEHRGIHAMVYSRIANLYVYLKDPEGAIQAASNGIEMLGGEYPALLIDLHHVRAKAYSLAGDRGMAYETGKQALEIARELNEKLNMISLMQFLGEILAESGDLQEAREMYLEALDICDELGMTSEFDRQRIRVLLANLKVKTGELEEANEIFDDLLRAGQVWHSNLNRYTWVSAQAADFYVKTGAIARAEKLYKETLETCREANLSEGVTATLLKLADLYRKEKRNGEAIEIYLEVLERPGVDSESPRTLEARRALADLYHEEGNLTSAYEHLQTCFDLTLRTKDILLDDRLNRLRIEHRVEQHRKSVEKERAQRQQVEEELQQTTLRLIEKSELIESLRGKVQGVLRDLQTSEIPRLNSALQQIISHVASSSARDNRETVLLQTVNDTYYDELQKRHPMLTPGQVKLCGLLRAGLESQEIMEILHITSSGLYKQRARLRKRLGIPTAESLERYLAGIG